MIIDTDKAVGWIRKHLMVCIPAETGMLSWWGALRWQAAVDSHSVALTVFYFFVSASSGVMTLVLIVIYFTRLGLFE